MIRPDERFAELGLLAAELCEGEITPEQAARLERLASQSDDARRYFLDYVQLHGELFWASAGAGRAGDDEATARAAPARPAKPVRQRQPGRLVWTTISVAVALTVVIAGFLTILRGPEQPVARIARSYEAIWLGDNSWLSAADVPLKTGQQLRLEAGCAEIVFASGARLIVQGPATLRVAGSKAASLSAGKVAVTVPRQASGFAVWTPIGTVVDLGTEFGLKVGERGSSEIHVFAGVVELQMADRTGGRHRLALAAGQAVRVWLPAETAHARIEQVATEANGFVRDLPPRQVATGSVAALRSFAREHPDLIHHYPFEGSTPAEICRDCRGTMRLVETVMHGGRGDGRIVYASEGADKTTRAIQPARSGNAMGVALQTEDAFQPPASMTVEMLVNFARFEVWDEDSVAVALGTRADDQRCGFFAVAAAGGQFVQLFDAGGPWLESGVVLHPGEWYYVASTFRSDSDKTVVNTYLANITREDRGLYHAVRNRTVRGVPATGRLGVGKGFDWEGAHAYPWSGSIDEVAIYAAVLDQKELERHLAAIYPNQVGK